MAYSPLVAEVVQELGYKWIILDEVAATVPLDPTKTYKNSAGLHFFFRERNASFKILSAQLGTADSLIREFSDRLDKNQYLLTAMDGETFGHHRLGLEQLLVDIYKEPRLPTVKISDLPALFPDTIVTEPRPSNWALTPKDLAAGNFYSRWDDPDNPIHHTQWELLNLALRLGQNEPEPQRTQLDAALHSDQFWWASARPWWSLEMIERGAYDLLTAINSFKNVSAADKKQAYDLYIQIITTGFEWQRNGIVANLSRQHDEEIKATLYRDVPMLTKDDYAKMIAILEKQMLTAAQNQEYSRAEQFKKRIGELQTELNKS